MPVVKKHKIQSDYGVVRGVLVDCDGYFVSRVQWDASKKRPVLNKRGTPKEKRVRLLSLDKNPNAANVPSSVSRWDFEACEWVLPTESFALVCEKTGSLITKFKGFGERLPEVPEGTVVVDDEVPKSRDFKPVYDKEKQRFVRPRRVGLVDAEGVVQNIVLENPNDTAPDVAVPEGWARFDDRDWPVNDDGSPVVKGDVLVSEASAKDKKPKGMFNLGRLKWNPTKARKE